VDNDGSQVLQQVLFFALLVFGLYLLAIRPQRARARALAQVRSSLRVGSRVMTTAGIHGTVTALGEGTEADTALIEVAPGVQVRFATAAVVRILDPDGSPGAADGGTTA
jgi:preprotein translocase subunit YajC